MGGGVEGFTAFDGGAGGRFEAITEPMWTRLPIPPVALGPPPSTTATAALGVHGLSRSCGALFINVESRKPLATASNV